MAVRAFFPADLLSLSFIVILLAWFAFWLKRMRAEAAHLDSVRSSMKALEQCVPPLHWQQRWRDRQRIQGLDMGADPATFFDGVCKKTVPASVTVPPTLLNHLRTIFVAGCEESLLDTSELNAQTCEELARKSQQYRYELLLMLLTGALGTLLSLSSRVSQTAFPSFSCSALLAIGGGILFLRYRQSKLAPSLAELRQKTSSLWIPKLYPTVAQRAAQWAIHTLHNAARVSDSSTVIEKHALQFVSSVESARQAAETFAGGMREFSHGIEISDRALQNAQSRLASEVEKFADSLQRWGRFEDEIRSFYGAVEGHQKQIANDHRTFEAMLSGYYDLVRQSTNVLQKAASEITSAAGLLPDAFRDSANTMTKSTAESQAQMMDTVDGLGAVIRSTYREESAQVLTTLQGVLQPVLHMEERLRALATPFESASSHLEEIATNLWRLNDRSATDLKLLLENWQANSSRVMKAGS